MINGYCTDCETETTIGADGRGSCGHGRVIRTTLPDTPDMPSGVHEALWQMFKDGPIWDGNLVCKASRKWLVDKGMAARTTGWNFLTGEGVEMAVSLGMGDRKEKENMR